MTLKEMMRAELRESMTAFLKDLMKENTMVGMTALRWADTSEVQLEFLKEKGLERLLEYELGFQWA